MFVRTVSQDALEDAWDTLSVEEPVAVGHFHLRFVSQCSVPGTIPDHPNCHRHFIRIAVKVMAHRDLVLRLPLDLDS